MSLPQARRLAVAAQGLGRPAPVDATPSLRQVRAICRRLGVVQIDSVNVVARSHLLPLFSRLGGYDRSLLDRLAYEPAVRRRGVFETWAHEASYVPVESEPLLRWRTRAYADRHPQPAGSDAVLAAVRGGGAVAASDLERRTGAGSWWAWTDTKRALEWLFGVGRLRVATRRRSFERVYDVPERVLPAPVLATPEPSAAEAKKALLVQAAAALGVATADDLFDWWRLNRPLARPLLAELVAEGMLEPVRVHTWSGPAYVLPGTVIPRQASGAALLSPFDNLVFHRPRVERLWGLRLRLEIYTPAPRRVHGYYVLPFLLGDRLAARVDLKADRAQGVLRVLASHAEGPVNEHLTSALLGQLRALADWLTLPAPVQVEPRGDLAEALAASAAKRQLSAGS